MKTINTAEIEGQKLELGAEAGLLDLYDGLKTPFTEDVLVLSDAHKRQIESIAATSAEAYGHNDGTKEPTAAQLQCGVPSLVVRIDCTIKNGQIEPYEMEDSPSGQGITDVLLDHVAQVGVKDQLLDHYGRLVGQIPHILVSPSRRHGTDDQLIVGKDSYTFGATPAEVSEGDHLVIVKAIPGDANSHQPFLGLQDRTLAPLETEGNKSYLQRLGIVSTVSTTKDLLQTETGELRSQVVKATVGSMAMGVSIYLDSNDKAVFGKRGTVTAGRLNRDLEAYAGESGALTQEFHAPLQLNNPEGRSNAIMRVFTLLETDPMTGQIKAEAIGGCFVARPELVVHGASNAVAGAILVE